MSLPVSNPFDLNRASDFSDIQIRDYWVDYSDGGLIELLEPKSKSSIHLLGGKGSGKTHLMRYCSFQVQKLRNTNSLLKGLQDEGYVGIFSRANTFDTGRFQGKGQDHDKWGVLFNYYFEIRLCEQLLLTLIEIAEFESELAINLDSAAQESIALFDYSNDINIDSITSLHETLVGFRKEVDIAVNNCAFTRTLDVSIRVTPGNLLFGIPELICKHSRDLKDIQFLYLIDEIENFSKEKQEFLNTLIRHRRGPCSFRIGARLYGIKTLLNYGSNEENKEGSEFKRVFLDQVMRSHSGIEGYERFSRRLCVKRLIDAKLLDSQYDEESLIDRLDTYFEKNSADNYYINVTNGIVKEKESLNRKYFKRLAKQLTGSLSNLAGLGVRNAEDVDEILQCLICNKYPLLEKLNIFIFYKEWYQKNNLKEASVRIGKDCSLFCEKKSGADTHKHVYGHFSRDLLAQLYRDYSRKITPMYAGLDSFIRMSAGVPRNLLIILHNVYKWAKFNGEKPFSESPITIESQCEAILESSHFYYEEDARPGTEIPRLKESISKLCEYLRDVRYSSKPVDPSPLAFSIDESLLTDQSLASLKHAENWSYIFKISRGRPNANTQRVDAKYQLNPMLSAKWDLPISRRGDIRLQNDMVDAIFGDNTMNYDSIKSKYISGYNAPNFDRSTGSNLGTLQLDFEDKNEL